MMNGFPVKGHYFGQFVISRTERHTPDRYHTHQYGQWIISSHDSLPIASLISKDRHPIGCLVGHAYDTLAGAFIKRDLISRFDSCDTVARKERAIHELLRRLAGRFVCLIIDKDIRRLYLDAAGSLSCVYWVNQEIIASTPGLILNRREYDVALDKELAGLVNISSGGWYPGGVTPHRDIYRVLPNHYFDLDSWRTGRHWPKARIATVDCVDDKVNEIAAMLKSFINSVAYTRRAYLPITAGRDSRMLLACAKDALDRIKLITFVNTKAGVDESVVRRLDVAHHLNVQYLPVRRASPQQRECWYYEVGHCVGGAISEIHGTLEGLDSTRMIMPGRAGGVGKGHYYKLGDNVSKEITARELLWRLHLPAHKVLQRACHEWLRGLEGLLNTFQLLDVAEIEHRNGAWAGPTTYGQVRYLDHVFPIVSRTIFENMVALPAEYKWKKHLPRDVIRREWPELLEFPFNRYTGPRGWLETARALGSLPIKFMRALGRHSF